MEYLILDNGLPEWGRPVTEYSIWRVGPRGGRYHVVTYRGPDAKAAVEDMYATLQRWAHAEGK